MFQVKVVHSKFYSTKSNQNVLKAAIIVLFFYINKESHDYLYGKVVTNEPTENYHQFLSILWIAF